MSAVKGAVRPDLRDEAILLLTQIRALNDLMGNAYEVHHDTICSVADVAAKLCDELMGVIER